MEQDTKSYQQISDVS